MTNQERAKHICSTLSLKEKVGQITQQIAGFQGYRKENGEIVFSEELKNIAKEYGIGVMSAMFRADPWSEKGYGAGIEIGERDKALREFQDFVMEHSEHKIPMLVDIEASHGMQSLGSVMYPVGLCSAASWNPELYGRMMQRVGEEIKASGNHIALVTMIDLARDPRWGRSEECLGEDAYLASKYVKSGVKGMKAAEILVCAKHFFGSGDAEGGGNTVPITTSEREIREVLLPTAKAAVDAGCDVIMVAYNTLNGVPLHFSQQYLTEVLRGELGFEGIILSDGMGIYSSSSQVEIPVEKGAEIALRAGVDLSLWDAGCFVTLVETAQDNPELQQMIERSCERIIEKKIELGLLENPYIDEENLREFMPNEKGQKLAYEMATEAITLVKNSNNTLPLKKETKVCLIGENAANIYFLLGDYTSDRLPGEGASIKEAIESAFPNVVYEKGWSFDEPNFDESCLKVVQDCDVVLLCMGGSSVRHANVKFLPNGTLEESSTYIDCGEGGDSATLTLTNAQRQLLEALKTKGKPIVSLFVIGRAYAISDMIEQSDAALICWYPGQEGGRAIADILLGHVNPSGRMPVSIPEHVGCVPACYNAYAPARKYRDVNGNANPYTFGYGLSYTTFDYSDIKAVQEQDVISVSGSVTNVGSYDGKETIQVYVHKAGGTVTHRPWELYRFDKILLKVGDTHNYQFEIPLTELEDVINGELPEQITVRVKDFTKTICIERKQLC